MIKDYADNHKKSTGKTQKTFHRPLISLCLLAVVGLALVLFLPSHKSTPKPTPLKLTHSDAKSTSLHPTSYDFYTVLPNTHTPTS